MTYTKHHTEYLHTHTINTPHTHTPNITQQIPTYSQYPQGQHTHNIQHNRQTIHPQTKHTEQPHNIPHTYKTHTQHIQSSHNV